MTEDEMRVLHQKIVEGSKVATAEALERHCKLGEEIAVWKDGKVVTLSADRIPLNYEDKKSRFDQGG